MAAVGVLEELFIATDPAGLKQVWFRNYSVTANLGLRAGWEADPESVVWGPDQASFVVRTGATPNVQRYRRYTIIRNVNQVFDPGVIPTVTLQQTWTPYTSTLVLITVVPTLTDTTYKTTLNSAHNLYTDSTVSLSPACVESGGTVTFNALFNESEVISGAASFTKTVADLLTGGDGVTVQYGLNTSGHLILYIVAKVPSTSVTATKTTNRVTSAGSCTPTTDSPSVATTTTITPRSGQFHLWIINHVTNVVLFRTAKSSASFTHTKHTIGDSAFLHRSNFSETPGHPIFCPPLVTCVSPGTYISGPLSIITGGVIEQTGDETLNDSLAAILAYVTGDVDPITSASDTANNVKQGLVGTLGLQFGYQFNYTSRTWTTTNTPWTYSIDHARGLVHTSPIRVLLVVQRSRTGLTQQGLFLMDDLGLMTMRQLQPFTTGTIKIITANSRHVVWTKDSDAFLTAMYLGLNGRTLRIGTAANAIASKFRLLDPRVLFDAKEVVNANPAGFFPDAYEANDNPTLVIADDGGMPLRPELVPFEKMAVVPAGIVLPVTPDG